MDTKDAGRKGGSSRSERKRAASAANLTKARAKVAKALATFNQAKLDAADAAWLADFHEGLSVPNTAPLLIVTPEGK
jgi:hypothetical protein